MSNRHRWPLIFATLLIACGLSSTHASEKPTTVYTGTLGKQSVVFDFAAHSEVSGPSYFYTRHHRTLGLDGTFGTDHLTLHEGLTGGDIRPLITLDRQPDGGWRGNWQGPNGKTLPILLHPAKPTPPAADAPPYLKQLYASNTFEYLRLVSLKPQAYKRERFMGHTLSGGAYPTRAPHTSRYWTVTRTPNDSASTMYLWIGCGLKSARTTTASKAPAGAGTPTTRR